MSLRPIKTDKHEVTFTVLATDQSTQQNITLATGVQSADKNASTECEIGSHVKWIFCELNFSPAAISNPKIIHWCISINPTGAGNVQSPALYYQTSRSRVLKRGMEMLPVSVGTVFKRIFVVKIPRKAQRMAEGSKLMFNYICTSAETVNVCGFFVYKEIY